MLDLQPRIHFEEVEGALRPQQELDRAGVHIVAGARQRHRRRRQPLPQLVVHRDRGRLFDELLVASLNRALALAQMHDVALRIAEALHLDMSRGMYGLFHVDGAVAKRLAGLALGQPQRRGELVRPRHEANALAAATSRRLQQHRIAELTGNARSLRRILQARVVARHNRHAGLDRDVLGGGFLAQQTHHRPRRSHEPQPGVRTCVGKVGVLGQKTIAGMNCLGATALGGRQDLLDVEIALRSGGRTDVHGFVGHAHVQRRAVGVAVHGDAGEAEVTAGADDPHSNLAAIGDQHLAEGQWRAAIARSSGLGGATRHHRPRHLGAHCRRRGLGARPNSHGGATCGSLAPQYIMPATWGA